MPSAPLRPCTTPGCPNLTDRSRCTEHRTQAEQQRGSAHQRGYDRRWRAFARWYLARHPHCAHPDCAAIAAEVDHIDGLGPRGPRGYDPDNCRALCKPHHSARTAADQPGGFNAR